VTIDGDTLSDGTVTLRHRDSMEQEKVTLDELVQVIQARSESWERPQPLAALE
jgi:glycyl-tRNA synthetase